MKGLSCTAWHRGLHERVMDAVQEGARLQYWAALALSLAVWLRA